MTRDEKVTLLILIQLLLLAVWIQPVKVSGTTIFFDDFDEAELSEGWEVENLGGSYSLSNGILTISKTGTSMTIYREYSPQSEEFTISAKVKATSLAAFALRIHAGSLPIFGSTEGAQLEFDNGIGDKHFEAVWNSGGWTWTNIYKPVVSGVWFILQMHVQEDPFIITFNVFDEVWALLGTRNVNNLGFSYSNIRYICFHVWSGPDDPIYDVDWLKIEGDSGEIAQPYVIIDQSFASNYRADVGSTQTIGFHAKWDNGSNTVGGDIYVNGTCYVTNETGWVNFNYNLSSVGRMSWVITGINISGVTSYNLAINGLTIIWDRIKTENRIETLSPYSVQVTSSLKFEYDDSPVQDATVKINGIIAEHVGNGVYRATLNTLMPYLSVSMGIERQGFNLIIMVFASALVGNMILEIFMAVLGVFIVLKLNSRFRMKKWHANLMNLESLLTKRGLVEVKEASEATGISMAKIKDLFLDLMIRKPTLHGLFIKNDTEFVLESFLINTINEMGKFSFDDLCLKFRVTANEAEEIVSKLIREGKIKGAFTRDGKTFISEDRLMKEIGKDFED